MDYSAYKVTSKEQIDDFNYDTLYEAHACHRGTKVAWNESYRKFNKAYFYGIEIDSIQYYKNFVLYKTERFE